MAGYVCPECGLDYDTIAPSDAKVAIRSFPRRYRAALAAAIEEEGEDAVVRRRPDAATWSALEYTGHVARLFDDFAPALRRMFLEERPTIDLPADADAQVVADGWNERAPDEVLARLDDAAGHLAGVIDQVNGDGWLRTAVFPWGERDLLTMARNAVHEGSHHLRDVERVLAAVRGR